MAQKSRSPNKINLQFTESLKGVELGCYLGTTKCKVFREVSFRLISIWHYLTTRQIWYLSKIFTVFVAKIEVKLATTSRNEFITNKAFDHISHWAFGGLVRENSFELKRVSLVKNRSILKPTYLTVFIPKDTMIIFIYCRRRIYPQAGHFQKPVIQYHENTTTLFMWNVHCISYGFTQRSYGKIKLLVLNQCQFSRHLLNHPTRPQSSLIICGHGKAAEDYYGTWCEGDDRKVKGELFHFTHHPSRLP